MTAKYNNCQTLLGLHIIGISNYLFIQVLETEQEVKISEKLTESFPPHIDVEGLQVSNVKITPEAVIITADSTVNADSKKATAEKSGK